jgi:hypothetical protein
MKVTWAGILRGARLPFSEWTVQSWIVGLNGQEKAMA